ncbi:precorrin-2 methylase [Rhodobium orientis]|nr:SAM-dependent methyltransferase [Rhodobium orientis]MBB4305186.1 precorrin-2 methylase [Rhodobium orientis]
MSYDIYIVGIGIKWIEHITLEVDRVLGFCKEILYIERAPGIEEYFAEKADFVTNLTDLYSEDSERTETYHEMATRVVDSALEHSPVAFALYGHPTIYAYPPFLVREMAASLGLSVKLLPGISALDCLFCDLAIDPSVNGIQMFEATDLLLREHPINTAAATVIWQIGSLETALFSSARSAASRFDRFRDYLLRFFPEHHPIYAVYSQPHPMLKSQVHKFEISKIEQFSTVLHSAVTLYLPPRMPSEVKNVELLSKLQDPNYLRNLTAT